MTLYEIDQALLACIDPETGEIDAEAWETLNLERDVKVENTALLIKDLTAEAALIREEEKALAERRKHKENTVARLKENLNQSLEGQKFETARVVISFRKSEVVEIAPDAEIPKEYIRWKNPEVDKVRLKAALKDGLEFEGIQLAIRQNITVK